MKKVFLIVALFLVWATRCSELYEGMNKNQENRSVTCCDFFKAMFCCCQKAQDNAESESIHKDSNFDGLSISSYTDPKDDKYPDDEHPDL